MFSINTITELRILIRVYARDKSIYPTIVRILEKIYPYPITSMTELLQDAIIDKLDIGIISMIYNIWKKRYDQYCIRETEKSYLFRFSHNCACNAASFLSFFGDIVTFINSIYHMDVDYYRELAKVLNVHVFESDSERHEYLKKKIKI
jgi:hypothetical protein